MRIMVFGTFDLLHPGHLFVLSEAGKRGDVTVVVARDANVQRMKSIIPHESERERKANIARAFPRYTVVLGDPKDFFAPIRRYNPQLILLGYDQRLPPGIDLKDLPPTERLPAFEPKKHKSSLKRRYGR